MRLVEWISVDRVAIASIPIGAVPIPPESSSVVNIQEEKLKEKQWLCHEILDHYLDDNGQLEFLPD